MKFCIVGLGYVGLPLAIKLAQKNIKIIGHDINKTLIRNLKKGVDITNEVTLKNFHKLKNLSFSSNIDFFHDIDVFIVTLPTPVDNHNVPDLSHVIDATKKIALNLKKNSLIVFESTFYPGFTDETLVPILEKYSGLKINKDFYCGYSPERINPGDKEHTLENTTKLISGSSKLALNKLHKIYAE